MCRYLKHVNIYDIRAGFYIPNFFLKVFEWAWPRNWCIMGANSSSLSELSTNETLLRLAGSECITPNDPFWNQLLSFSFNVPRTRWDFIINVICRRDTTLTENWLLSLMQIFNFSYYVIIHVIVCTVNKCAKIVVRMI